MNVVSAVANLQKERDYYKEQLDEARAVIKQLNEGPGLVEYIHPLDVAEILNNLTSEKDYIDVFKITDRDGEAFEIGRTGKKYRQSALMPTKMRKYA